MTALDFFKDTLIMIYLGIKIILLKLVIMFLDFVNSLFDIFHHPNKPKRT